MEMTKDIYKAKMQAQLAEWTARLGVLKAKADQATADARIALLKQHEELQSVEAAAKKQLTEIEQTLADSWQTVKDGVEKKWDQLSGSVEAIWSKVSPEKSVV